MKNLSTGTGLALLAAAIVAYPFASSLAPNANAVGVGTTAVSAVAAAATAQGAPTIVWYQAVGGNGDNYVVFRAWSDGRIEGTQGYFYTQSVTVGNTTYTCRNWASNMGSPSVCGASPWRVVSDPASGYSFRFDGNNDDSVDGVDLGQMLAAWGPVTRDPVPPSDCPLNLINP
jgi:hypothetical protein